MYKKKNVLIGIKKVKKIDKNIKDIKKSPTQHKGEKQMKQI